MNTKKFIVWSLLFVAVVVAVAEDTSVDVKKKKEDAKQVEIPTLEGKTDVEEHKQSKCEGYGQGGDMDTNDINDDLDDIDGYRGGGRGWGGGGRGGGRGWGGGGRRGWGGGRRGGRRGWGGGGRRGGGGGGWRGGGGGW